MEQFYTLLTDVGKAKIANATALQTKVKFSKLLVGDSNGSYYEPTETQTKLRNKVWEGGIGNISIDKDNPNWVVLESVIPSNIGGFTIREVGIEDEEGDLVVIAKYPQTYKPKIEDGSTKDLIIKTILEVTNVDTITLKVDPTIILATKKDIENVEQKVDIKLKTVDTTVEKLNSNNKEFITKITNTINESEKKLTNDNIQNKQELNKKVQDFIDTKGQKNGIAGLDEEGKVKKEQLPKTNNGMILGVDGSYYEPCLMENSLVEINRKIYNQNEITLLLEDENYIFGTTNNNSTLIKINKKTNTIESSYKFNRENINIDQGHLLDDNYIFIETTYTDIQTLYKINKNNLYDLKKYEWNNRNYTMKIKFSDDNFLYGIRNDKALLKINKSTLQIDETISSTSFDNISNVICNDTKYLYCIVSMKLGGYCLAKINKSDFTLEKTIQGIAFNTYIKNGYDDKYLYILKTNPNILTKISKETFEIIETLQINDETINNSYVFLIDNKYIFTNSNDKLEKEYIVAIYDTDFKLKYKGKYKNSINEFTEVLDNGNLKLITFKEVIEVVLGSEIKYYKKIGGIL